MWSNISNARFALALTHWGRSTHICVGKLTIIGSDSGLSPGRRQAIVWTNAGILLIGPLETNFSEILIGIKAFSFRKMHLKISSAKWRPFCLGLNELMTTGIPYFYDANSPEPILIYQYVRASYTWGEKLPLYIPWHHNNEPG